MWQWRLDILVLSKDIYHHFCTLSSKAGPSLLAAGLYALNPFKPYCNMEVIVGGTPIRHVETEIQRSQISFPAPQ